MITIVEIQQATAIGFFHQLGHHALSEPAPLMLQQSPVTRLGGSPNIVGQAFPPAPRGQAIQNPLQDCALINTGPPGPRRTRDESLERAPVRLGQSGRLRFARHVRQRGATRISSAIALLPP